MTAGSCFKQSARDDNDYRHNIVKKTVT